MENNIDKIFVYLAMCFFTPQREPGESASCTSSLSFRTSAALSMWDILHAACRAAGSLCLDIDTGPTEFMHTEFCLLLVLRVSARCPVPANFETVSLAPSIPFQQVNWEQTQ